MNLKGSEYYYIKNGQGDIIGLLESNGTEVVSYIYDTWGKLVRTTGTLASTVGVKNPYRYGGYRYDTETGLYYLQSRYYNPEWGRFINADSTNMLDNTVLLLDNNLFAYCANNPINNYDPSGYGYTNPTKPLNDDFLKNPDGSYKTGKDLDNLYKNEKDPEKKRKLRNNRKS